MRQLKRKSLKKRASTKTGGKKSMKKTKKVMKKRGGFFSQSKLPGMKCSKLATNVDKAVCQYLKLNYYKSIKNEKEATEHVTKLNTLKDNFTDEETENYNIRIDELEKKIEQDKLIIGDASAYKSQLSELHPNLSEPKENFSSYINKLVSHKVTKPSLSGMGSSFRVDGVITHISYKKSKPIFHVNYFKKSINTLMDRFQIESDNKIIRDLPREWTRSQVESNSGASRKYSELEIEEATNSSAYKKRLGDKLRQEEEQKEYNERRQIMDF